jgi:ribonuclease T2
MAIPGPLSDPDADDPPTARAVESAFQAANPGLSDRGMAVTCNRQGIIEVRVCLTKRLGFRRCGEVDASGCRRATISLPDNN